MAGKPSHNPIITPMRTSPPPIQRPREMTYCAKKNPQLAGEIVRELKKENLGVPVSVKTRLGWSREDEILEFAKILNDAGADALSIHGRTKIQGYAGKANWEMIAQVKQSVKIPVLANGDVTTREEIKKCLKTTQADGVLIGRGALGQPWIFAEQDPSLSQKIQIIFRHAELHLAQYGDDSMATFRKHLAWYVKEKNFGPIASLKDLKVKLMQVKSLDELRKLLGVCQSTVSL